MSALRPGTGALSSPRRGSGSWRCCCWWWWAVVVGAVVVGSGDPRMSAEACPSSCSCSSTRISCVDPERDINAFPVLQSEAEMENITDMWVSLISITGGRFSQALLKSSHLLTINNVEHFSNKWMPSFTPQLCVEPTVCQERDRPAPDYRLFLFFFCAMILNLRRSPAHALGARSPQTRIMCNLHCVTDLLPSWATSHQRGGGSFRNDSSRGWETSSRPSDKAQSVSERVRPPTCMCVRARARTETRTPDTTVQILAQTLPKMAYMSVFKWTTAAEKTRCWRGRKSHIFLIRVNILLGCFCDYSAWHKISVCIWNVL